MTHHRIKTAPLAGALALVLLAGSPALAQTTAPGGGPMNETLPPGREDGQWQTGGYADALRRLGDDAQVPAPFQAEQSPLTIVELDGQDVHAPSGETIGEVDKIVLGPDGERWLVFDHGGFLGFNERKVALPLDRFVMRGDELTARGVTEEDVRNLPGVERRWEDYERLDVQGPLGIDIDETDLNG